MAGPLDRRAVATRRMSLALGLFAAGAWLALRFQPQAGELLTLMEDATYDLRMATRPPQRLQPDLLLTGLTDYDHDSMPDEIESRQLYYDLIETFTRLGVSTLLFDVVFISERDFDGMMALAMSNAGAPATYLPYHFYITQQYPSAEVNNQRKIAITQDWFLPYRAEMGGEFGPGIQAQEIKLPTETLMAAARGLGAINVRPAGDGVVRDAPLLIRFHDPRLGDNLYPSISLRAVLDRLGVRLRDLRVRFGDAIEFESGTPPVTTRIPINEHGEMLVNFREGRTFTERGLSAGTLMAVARALARSPEVPPRLEIDTRTLDTSIFRGATVLLGDIAVGSTDIRPTPIDRHLPMITLHANVIHSILNRDFVHRAPAWAEPAVTLLTGLLSGFYFGRIGYMRSFIFAAVVLPGYLGAAWLVFWRWSVWLPVVVPMLTLVLGGILILVYHLVNEDKRRAVIRAAFEKYTSPEVVEEILQNLDDPALWGQKRHITTLFVDIRGFTTLTERTSPEAVVAILSEYYHLAVQAIQRHGGIPNKFIGDAIMALFNAPRTLPHPEEAACRAAVDIQLAVARLNAEVLRPRFDREIHVGAGVNSGEAIVGIVGRDRIEYTALGDEVNVAARLQANAGPGQVLIGESTHDALRTGAKEFLQTSIHEVRHIPEIVLKGMSRRFSVYELCYERRTQPRA